MTSSPSYSPILYRFCQALSSSALSQSFLRDGSLATAVAIVSFKDFVFRKRMKSNISSYNDSGICSISFRIDSFFTSCSIITNMELLLYNCFIVNSISERKMTYLGLNIWYNHFVRVLSEPGMISKFLR